MNKNYVKVIDKKEPPIIDCEQEIQMYLKTHLKKFNKDFMITGNMAKTKNITAYTLEGIKKDTIYEILIVLRKCHVINFKIIPKYSFYRKNDNLIKEYVFGHIYITQQPGNKCFGIYIDSCKPFKTDTMHNKFSFRLCNVQKKDSLIICDNK